MSEAKRKHARPGRSTRQPVGDASDGILGSSSLLGQLRLELAAGIKSRGGRPSLEGTARRQKIPMTDADWEKLEALANALRVDGVHATAGQVGAQLLHDGIARVSGASGAYPDESTRGARTLAAAERIDRRGSRAAGTTHLGTPLHVELPDVTIAVHPVAGAAGRATGVAVTDGRGGARWTVHSIVLHASRSK
jgi:hypothetical protein